MAGKISEAISEALAKGYQVDPDAFKLLEEVAKEVDAIEIIDKAVDAKRARNDQQLILIRTDIEAVRPRRPEEIEEEVLSQRVERAVSAAIEEESVVLKDPSTKLSPSETAEGYAALFKSRFEKLLMIVSERVDAHQIRRIEEIRTRGEGRAKIAGLVMSKKARRDRVELVMDDTTGKLTVFASEHAKKAAAELSLDQLAIVDVDLTRRGVAIARQVQHPDVPERAPNHSKKQVYVVLLSDLHIGSKTFLNEALQRLLHWLQGKLGDSSIVSRIKYIVIGGDVVDGIGVYPEQEDELEEKDIYRQYLKAAQFIEQIPNHMRVFISPGNHDPGRQALPQPAIPRKYAEMFYALGNVAMLGNPAYLSLHGVKILVYHGKSLDDVVATTPGITYSRPAAAMKVLLRARHLAPMFGGRTPIAPEPEDHLVIDDVPDVFHSGHIHAVDVDSYRGTLIVNSGTFQAQTKYQANMGVVPTPGIVPMVDLANLEVVLRDFTKPYGAAG